MPYVSVFVSDSKDFICFSIYLLTKHIRVQFILGRPNLTSTGLLQLPKYEAAVELGLAGAYLDVIPCSGGTLGLYVGSGCGKAVFPAILETTYAIAG